MGLWENLESNSGAVIAGFTIIIAFTTIWYVVVSMKLLKQSRNAFLADMVLRMMEIYRSEAEEILKAERQKTKPDILIGIWSEGYYKAFIEMDKKLGTDLIKLLKTCLETARKNVGRGTEKSKKEKERSGREKGKLEKK